VSVLSGQRRERRVLLSGVFELVEEVLPPE
jgi:hypothetical protein